MSFWSWLKGEESKAVKEGDKEVRAIEAMPVVKDVEADVEPVVKKVESDVHVAEADEKAILKGLVLQTMTDEKAVLKNAEGGLSEDAEKAVQQVIDSVVAALIQDGLKAL